MIDAATIQKTYERNMMVIKMQVEGLKHEDSMLQLPFRGNCLNWVLGHLAATRQLILAWMDAPQVMNEAEIERYTRESEPVVGEGEDVIRLERMIEILEESQEAMNQRLGEMTEAELQKEMNEKGTQLWERLEFYAWHEGYHAGQMEYLRQLAGKDDKVV